MHGPQTGAERELVGRIGFRGDLDLGIPTRLDAVAPDLARPAFITSDGNFSAFGRPTSGFPVATIGRWVWTGHEKGAMKKESPG